MSAWIRVDCGLADHLKVKRLASLVFPSSAHDAASGAAAIPDWVKILVAEGLLVNLWSQVLEHQEDGVLAERSDDELEHWARWRGVGGQFASAFRRLFVTDGRIQSWEEYQGVWIERRKKDRLRKRAARDSLSVCGTSSGGSGEQSADIPVLRNGTIRNEKKAAARMGGENDNALEHPIVDLAYLNRCVDTLNAVMAANPHVRDPRPVLALKQTGAVRWDRDGIPLDLALAVIEERGAAFRPKGGKSIASLAYFDEAVRERWAALQGSNVAGSTSGVRPDGAPRSMREAILAKRGF